MLGAQLASRVNPTRCIRVLRTYIHSCTGILGTVWIHICREWVLICRASNKIEETASFSITWHRHENRTHTRIMSATHLLLHLSYYYHHFFHLSFWNVRKSLSHRHVGEFCPQNHSRILPTMNQYTIRYSRSSLIWSRIQKKLESILIYSYTTHRMRPTPTKTNVGTLKIIINHWLVGNNTHINCGFFSKILLCKRDEIYSR